MRRGMVVRFDAAPEAVRAAAIRALGAEFDVDGKLAGPLFGDADPASRLRVECSPEGAGTRVRLEAGFELQIPYFGWLVDRFAWFAARRALRHAAARLRAEVAGEVPPEALSRSRLLPPVTFTAEHAARVAAIAAVSLARTGTGATSTSSPSRSAARHRLRPTPELRGRQPTASPSQFFLHSRVTVTV